MTRRSPRLEIRTAVEGDMAEVSEVLGRAFDDDPVWRFVISGRPVAPRAAVLLGAMARVHLGHGIVEVAVDSASGAIMGAAAWGLPGHWRIPTTAYVRHIVKIRRALGWKGVPRIGVLAAIEKRHPRELHHYLAIIGTDPVHQGKGVGAALMAQGLERCDAEGLGAYLESSKESNAPYYARFGFEVTTPFTIKGGPTMYFMWRPAPT